MDFFPQNLLNQLYSNKISRQEYLTKLLNRDKKFEIFVNSYMNFVKMQDSEINNANSFGCFPLKGICSSFFANKTPKNVKIISSRFFKSFF